MSRYVNDQTGEQAFVASTTGWGDFSRWAQALNPKAAEDLIHLTLYGWTENVEEFRAQTRAALQKKPPAKDVLEIAYTLLRFSAGATVLVVSDGQQPS